MPIDPNGRRLSAFERPGRRRYRINHSAGETSVTRDIQTSSVRKSLFEVWGDANVVRAIIDGENNAMRQFLAGGLRIRGDLRFFSSIAVELGVLKKPL